MRGMRLVRLSVGDKVHYRSHGSTPDANGVQKYKPHCRAAIVAAEVGHPRYNLFVINPSGLFFDECDYDEQMSGGTWHLPDRGDDHCG